MRQSSADSRPGRACRSMPRCERDEEIARALEDDPQSDAARAGLRYVDGSEPGYIRRRCGRGFSYRDEGGLTVRSAALRARFAAIAIPPAWTDVWICRDPRGHVQATGRDEEGRKQHIYHEDWRPVRDEAKYRRMVAFGWVLPRVRRAVARDLRREGLHPRRVIAAVVRLLDRSAARIGYDEYAENGSFGLATLRKRHVTLIEAVGARLTFSGKSGQPWHIVVDDPKVCEVIEMCMDTPGHALFKYFDEGGRKRDLNATAVNDYLLMTSRHAIYASDFRTWAASVLAARSIETLSDAFPDSSRKSLVVRTVERVAEHLRNTPAVCRASYICPEVLESYEPGGDDGRASLSGLRTEERALLVFLESRLFDVRAR